MRSLLELPASAYAHLRTARQVKRLKRSYRYPADRNDVYYLFGNDIAEWWPTEERLTNVLFLAVGNYCSLHALSYLRDFSEVSRCVFVDVSRAQLRHLERCTTLMGSCSAPQEFIEKLMGVRFGRFGDWSTADTRQFQETTGMPVVMTTPYGLVVPSPVYLGGSQVYLLTLDDRYDRRPFLFGSRTTLVATYPGLHRGFLREGKLPARVDLELVHGSMPDMAPRFVDEHDGPVVIWLSNLPSFAPRVPRLRDFVQQADADPRVHLWADARCHPEWNELRTADHKFLEPHGYTDLALQKHAISDEPVIEVVPKARWEGPLVICGQVRGQRVLDEEFLGEPTLAATLVLHILHGNGRSLSFLDRAMETARANCRRLIVLEHNAASLDANEFKHPCATPSQLIERYGQPEHLVWCPGNLCARRNFLLVYDREQ